MGVEITDSIYLEHNGKLSGKISSKSQEKWLNSDLEESFVKAFSRIIQRLKIKPLESVIVSNNKMCLPLFWKAGLSIAFKSRDKDLKEIADKTATILPEILAIME